MKQFLLLCMVLLLSACGSEPDGTYADIGRNISTSWTFKGGKVTQKMWMGTDDSGAQEIEFPYELDGNKIKVTDPQSGVSVVLGTLQEDGSIKGSMMGGHYIKQ